MELDRFTEIRSELSAYESALLTSVRLDSEALSPFHIDILRYIFSFARLTIIQDQTGEDHEVSDVLAPHRWWVQQTCRSAINPTVNPLQLKKLLPELVARTQQQRKHLLDQFPSIDIETLEAEVCRRQLIVVSGGGGGGGYGYAGAFRRLHRNNLQPELLSGTSIGALISMFRARYRIFDQLPIIETAKRLSWTSVFRILDMNSRYGIPATLRLYLREALGSMFLRQDGEDMTFDDCEIPLLIVVTGLSMESFKHDLSFFEHFMDDAIDDGRISRRRLLQRLGQFLSVLQEFWSNPEALNEVVFGQDPLTRGATLLDAGGFSAAVPGLIHYDILRDAPQMHALLNTLYAEYGITRLSEGGLVNNLPVKPALQAVINGRIKQRNPVVLAMDCFSPQVSALGWYPIQQLVYQTNVKANADLADVYFKLKKRLKPTMVVPSVEQMSQAMDWTSEEISEHIPHLKDLCRSHEPLPKVILTSSLRNG
ncbi:MAG: patatin-like phospholipase family protein [Myxococcota bacterium]|nr:patatin-like phospholipase family protein [Myxococcota bacterium]